MILYNITYDEGEPQSASVFLGSVNLVSTKGSQNFDQIVEYLEAHKTTNDHDPEKIKELFDMAIVIGHKFAPLSERVSAFNGRIYFDGVEVHDAVAQAIVNFQTHGQGDFMPLVYFMEKIATNPQEHSREHLFRWLGKHDFAIATDGDIIAYKGVDVVENQYFSSHGGRAYVNGQLYEGKIPNVPGTVVEMPRNEVTFDPRNGCSHGLHVGNWRYASTFANKTLRVKVNPRDVVSVPTDSNDEKVRVCRYRVLNAVEQPDTELLFVGREVTKRIAKPIAQPGEPKAKGKAAKGQGKDTKKAKAPETPLPSTYEAFKRADFERLNINDLKWLANEWGVEVAWNADDGMTRTGRFAYKLDYAARGRRSKNAKVTKRTAK